MSSDLSLLTKSQELQLFGECNLLGSFSGLSDLCNITEETTSDICNITEETTKTEEDETFDVYEQTCNSEVNNHLTNIQAFVPTVQPPTPGVISNEEYLGPLNFEVFIDPHHGNKAPWVYSSLLNKVYISMLSAFPVDFKWTPVNQELYVRATPLFSLVSHAQEPVTRCIPHALGTDATNQSVAKHMWNHVIRCQHQGAMYQGEKDLGQHLSVIIPLGKPQSGTDTVRHMFLFMCKNSCPTGMNRKPLEVVFTLENEKGQVLGRSKVNIRVCSCPKRDKEKEEKEYMKNKDDSTTEPSYGKRRKEDKMDKKPPSDMENVDKTEHAISLKICGKHNYQAVLKYAHDLMAGEIVRHGTQQPFKKYVDDITEQMRNAE